MKRAIWLIAALTIGTTLGCGESSPAAVDKASETAAAGSALTVQGRVSHELVKEKARIVAIGADGKKIWAYLDKDGDFTLQLPVGQSYRLVIAHARSAGTSNTVVGQMLLTTSRGRTPWLNAHKAGVVNLGKLKPTTTAGNVSIQCSGCGDGDADDGDGDDDDDDGYDHGDDNPCYPCGGGGGAEKSGGYGTGGGNSSGGYGKGGGGGGGDDDGDDDDDDDCDLCGGGGSGSVEPSKQPGAEWCDDDDDDDDDADYDKPCDD